MADPQNDIVLLERVFLRIVTTESDEQFESVLAKFLIPVLHKLSSPQEGVRKKVMELLVHVNKRLKSRPQIQLPVEALLQQYQDASSSSFVLNFTMIYLKLGFPRLDRSRQAALLHALLDSVAGKPQQHQDSLLQLALGVVPYMEGPPKTPLTSPAMGLLRERLLDLLLLPYSGWCPTVPCLSAQSLSRLFPEGLPAPEELERAKLGALGFLTSGVFPEKTTSLHLLVAAADTRHSVASAAEMKLKAISSSLDWDDLELVGRLFGLYLGTFEASVPANDRRSPANTRIRLKLLPWLVKSRKAATMLPQALMVILDTLNSTTNTNVKLKAMALQFVQSMCLHNTETHLNLVGRQLMSTMLTLALPPEEVDSKLRVQACAALGQLGRKLPQVLVGDLNYLHALYQGLAKEHGEVRQALQEALSMWAPAFRNCDSATQGLVLALVTASMESSNPAMRQASVAYAAQVFSCCHVPSRYLLLLAAGDSQEEIRREALRVLHPTEGDSPWYPDFAELLQFVTDQVKAVSGERANNIRPLWYRSSEVVRYLRSSLHSSAGLSKDSTGEAPKVSRYVCSLLPGAVPGLYAHLLLDCLSSAQDVTPLTALLELVAAAPGEFAPLLDNQRTTLKGLLSSSKEPVRECSAELVGFLMASGTGDQFLTDMDELCSDMKSENLELRQGVTLALGFALSHRREMLGPAIDDARAKEAVASLCSQFLEALPLGPLVLSSCLALGEVGRALPFPEDPTLLALIQGLGDLLHNSKAPTKCRDQAARTMGLLCLGRKDFPHTRVVLESLLDSSIEGAGMEVHFTVGEAICCALLGPTSPLCRNTWTTDEADFVPPEGSSANLKEIEWLVPLMLDKFLCHPKPSVRQAACIWTLSLLKCCSHQAPVLSNIKRIQAALLNLLADRSDLTQSVASKGLSLLYELSDQSSRDELVALLLDTLTSGRRSTVAVTEDTRLFEEGTLGSAPSGGGLTTYRELCSLATDLNQPDLMYKFMHMANHHALWNSKKGAAFGFGSIAERAGEQLTERLGDLVPKIYRYRYDPNPGVRSSFISIWSTLVKEPHKTVDKYFREILQDLLQNLTSNEWRVRESSCLALADLCGGRRLDPVLDQVAPLWETLFRVRDDIKESVRKACDAALQALGKACLRTCDSQAGSSGERAVAVVLPCLAQGLSSPVAEVRQTSLSTLMKLSRSAGPLLKPHLALLFGALLNALSELEPQVLNQLSVRAGAETRDKLDAARVAASRSSPTMETINYCVQFVDGPVLSSLVPQLVEQTKGAVGLGTRAGCAHLAVVLTHQCPLELQPYAGKLLRAFVHGLSDRNATVRRCFATAVGNLAKVAKESDVEKLMSKLRAWYLESDDASAQWACAHTLQAVARHAPDVLRAHAAAALPLAFFAKHAKPCLEGESPATTWEEIWLEFTAGTESGLKLYLPEVVGLVRQGLESASWAHRGQAGTTAASIARTLGTYLEWDCTQQLLSTLLGAVSGRTWDGKESLLEALSAICTNCIVVNSGSVESPQVQRAVLDKVVESLLRESRKQNTVYREHAITGLAAVVEKHGLDCFAPLMDILEPELRKATSVSRGEASDGGGWQEMEGQLHFQLVGFQALGQAWPVDPITQEKLQARFCDLLLASFPLTTWKVQLAILKALDKFVLRLCWLNPDRHTAYDTTLASMTAGIVDVACSALDMVKYSTLCTEALQLLKDLVERVQAANLMWALTASSTDKLKACITSISKTDSNLELRTLAQELVSSIA